MLKKICFTVIAFAALGSLLAQEVKIPVGPSALDNATGMEFGVNAGPGLSILYNQHPLSSPRNPYKSTLSSSAVGLTWQYNFPKIISIHAEANFEQKGDFIYWVDNRGTTGDGQQVYTKSYTYDRIGYLTIPVTARLSFGKKMKFFTDLGFYAGFQTSASRVMSNTSYGTAEGGLVTEVSSTTDLSNDIRKVDGGIVTGIGVSIPLWKTLSFNFEARNNMGFANLNNNSPVYQNKFYNNNTVFLFGLTAFIGRPLKTTDQLRYATPVK